MRLNVKTEGTREPENTIWFSSWNDLIYYAFHGDRKTEERASLWWEASNLIQSG